MHSLSSFPHLIKHNFNKINLEFPPSHLKIIHNNPMNNELTGKKYITLFSCNLEIYVECISITIVK